MFINIFIYFKKLLLIDAQLFKLQANCKASGDKQALITYIFFEARIIRCPDGCLLIPLVLTKIISKIEIIPKELSAVDEITPFWFTKYVELNLQKQNLNFLIECIGICLYLCYPHCKLRKKCKIEIICLFVFTQNELPLFRILLL